MQQDTRQDGDRLTVGEAAARLNVTPDAIRSRLRRGTLDGGKDGDAWYVILPADEDDTTRQDANTTATGPDTTSSPATDRLVEQLRSEVEYLRSELTAARIQAAQERERADVLQREALQRIEALTAGPIDHHDARQDGDTMRQGATGSPDSAGNPEHDPGSTSHPDTPPVGLWGRLWGFLRGG